MSRAIHDNILRHPPTESVRAGNMKELVRLVSGKLGEIDGAIMSFSDLGLIMERDKPSLCLPDGNPICKISLTEKLRPGYSVFYKLKPGEVFPEKTITGHLGED